LKRDILKLTDKPNEFERTRRPLTNIKIKSVEVLNLSPTRPKTDLKSEAPYAVSPAQISPS
jgi:hypothetical protein